MRLVEVDMFLASISRTVACSDYCDYKTSTVKQSNLNRRVIFCQKIHTLVSFRKNIRPDDEGTPPVRMGWGCHARTDEQKEMKRFIIKLRRPLRILFGGSKNETPVPNCLFSIFEDSHIRERGHISFQFLPMSFQKIPCPLATK